MRLPNPWIAVPVLLSAVAGGIVGFVVTDASCAPGSCGAAAAVVAALVALGVGAGVGVVAVLAVRSIAEWREQADREITLPVDDEPAGPPTC